MASKHRTHLATILQIIPKSSFSYPCCDSCNKKLKPVEDARIGYPRFLPNSSSKRGVLEDVSNHASVERQRDFSNLLEDSKFHCPNCNLFWKEDRVPYRYNVSVSALLDTCEKLVILLLVTVFGQSWDEIFGLSCTEFTHTINSKRNHANISGKDVLAALETVSKGLVFSVKLREKCEMNGLIDAMHKISFSDNAGKEIIKEDLVSSSISFMRRPEVTVLQQLGLAYLEPIPESTEIVAPEENSGDIENFGFDFNREFSENNRTSLLRSLSPISPIQQRTISTSDNFEIESASSISFYGLPSPPRHRTSPDLFQTSAYTAQNDNIILVPDTPESEVLSNLGSPSLSHVSNTPASIFGHKSTSRSNNYDFKTLHRKFSRKEYPKSPVRAKNLLRQTDTDINQLSCSLDNLYISPIGTKRVKLSACEEELKKPSSEGIFLISSNALDSSSQNNNFTNEGFFVFHGLESVIRETEDREFLQNHIGSQFFRDVKSKAAEIAGVDVGATAEDDWL